LADTVVSAFNVTAQVTVVVYAHPDHEEKAFKPAVGGAVSVKEEPAA
jgi:hypothetical protein